MSGIRLIESLTDDYRAAVLSTFCNLYFLMSSLPGSRVFPAGLFDLPSQDADIIGHHVIEGLKLLLDSLQLHGLRLSLFGPADNYKLLKVNFILWPKFQSSFIPICHENMLVRKYHGSYTYFSAIVFASRAFLRLFLSSIILCSCCSCSRRVFSRLRSDTQRILHTKMFFLNSKS